ncbi:MAG: B12-binding domain-containing radical SAM protein [Spirochaetaceae bacterium]|nr:B12-binding domain-containing radical SAM protein [Spirochaetaceae bacterium]
MAKSKVLLVYPESPVTYWSLTHSLSVIGKKALLPPLGLLTIAGLFPEESFELKLVDMNERALRDRDIATSDLVMLSAMIVQRDSFRDVVARCRALGVPVAAGGPYPSSCPGEMDGVDYLILNEGEATLPPFIADWLAGEPKRKYADDSKPDLDSGPLPRFDLIDPRRYSEMAIQYSRGCPFACEFCDIIELFGRVPRVKSPARFIAELEALLAAKAGERVFVVDDNFIGNKVHAKELLRELGRWQSERGYPFSFTTEASVDLARDEELMDLMIAANFKAVFVGLETPSVRALADAGKRQNLAMDGAEAVAIMQEKGLMVMGGFIVGFDADEPGIFDEQIDFISRLAVPVAMIGLLTALPNTALRRRLEGEGRMLAESSGDNTNSNGLNFRPIMPVQTLIQGYHRVLREIYKPRAYFDRCLELLRRFPRGRSLPKPGERSVATPLGVLLLFRSLLRQSFSSYGAEYLRFIVKALRIGPRFVGDFIMMAIQGRHFILLTRRSLGAL